ncbi:DUF4142 domain-containing protein [Streptomyces hesseae]|uniref:DUF4142 domain-containing protein n=1 Tax=Streptomyces hesseae TaxID=3075519 RepID=A0ABU2SM96_9ACTN|nr:DUF4142 domain-containing protein [Streptomyces sp. DSM 40473]MDT0450102.1 DUF4142 domain-containing protein [Streptomyces sp. DSM 40473]
MRSPKGAVRSLTGTGLVVTALVATAAALLFPLWSYRDRAGPGTGAADLTAGSVSTRFGPLSAADRDFVARVRQAGLWELPAGQQAMERGGTAAVKRAGEHLVEGHTSLDRHVRDVAARLGVDLPSQATAEQRGWLSRLDAAHGSAYDREFTNVLRLAHGRVFALVGQIRAATRNAAVRELAEDANATVLDHMKVLEDTGLVDFDALTAQLGQLGAPPSGAPAPSSSPGAAVTGPPPSAMVPSAESPAPPSSSMSVSPPSPEAPSSSPSPQASSPASPSPSEGN